MRGQKGAISIWPTLGLFIGLSVGFFCLYLTTVARDSIGFGDSDELIGIGYLLGLPHPPGYPLMTGLVFIITHLITWGSIAYRAHLLAAGCQAITIGLFFLSQFKLVGLTCPNRTGRFRLTIAIMTAALMGVSYWFWLSANYLEVFPLNNLLVMGVITWTLYLTTEKKAQLNRTLKSGLMVGYWSLMTLMVLHHQSSWLIVPGLIIWWVPSWRQLERLKKWQFVMLGTTVLISGWVLLSLGLGWLAEREVLWTWVMKDGLVGLLGYWGRQLYSGVSIESGQIMGAIWKGWPGRLGLTTLSYWVTQAIPAQISWPIFGLMVMGLIAGYKRWVKLTMAGLIIMTLVTGPLWVFYLALPVQLKTIDGMQALATTERLWSLSFLIASLWLAPGLAFLVDRAKKWGPGLMILVIIGTLILAKDNYLRVNLSRESWLDKKTSQFLETLPENSVVLCFSDLSCFSLGYRIAVAGEKERVRIVPVTPQMQIGQGLTAEYEYPDNPFRILEKFAQAKKEGDRVFVVELPNLYYQLAGLDGQAYSLRPRGIGHEIVCPEQSDEKELTSSVFAKPLDNKKEDNRPTYIQLQRRIFETSEPYLGQATPCLTAIDHLEVAKKRQQEGEVQAAYLNTLWASMKAPESVAARFELARSYENQGFLPLAQREYARLERQVPNNSSVSAKVRQLPKLPAAIEER